MKTVFKIIFFLVIFMILIIITIIPWLLSTLWYWVDAYDSFDKYLDKIWNLSEATLNIPQK